ncbi:MAG TPA: DUF4352 domain-containing protein [Trebonia sp.]|jgi:hypothetical protein|nr:DUF4352 domain-containing protein [Trebonia sp.]
MTQPGDHGAPYGYPGQGYAQTRAWPTQYSPQAHFERLGFPTQQYPRLLVPGWGQPSYRPRRPHWLLRKQRAPQGPRSSSQPQHIQQQRYAPAPPRRGGEHTARNVLAGIAGFAVAAIGIALAAGAGHSSQILHSDSAGPITETTARVGSAITLSGSGSGEQMAVTVTKVIARAQPGDERTSASSGARLYAVQFRLRDTGSAAYSDAPSDGAVVTDSLGQSYGAVVADAAAGCPSFPAAEAIAPGSSGLGCIVFEVPKAAKVTQVQFTLDSGLGPDTGRWNIG